MSSSSFALAAVGDALILHAVTPHMTDPASAAVLDLIRGADVAFANFEACGFDPAIPGPIPQVESGGLWVNAGVDGLTDLKTFGFSMIARANNHAVDFGIAGMEETSRLLAQIGLVHAGVGPTLAAARAPAYLTTRAGRTALVSATDTTPPLGFAGHARPDIRGRPGVNPIRTYCSRTVDEETFAALAAALEIGHRRNSPIGTLSPDERTISGLGQPIHKSIAYEEIVRLDTRDVDENLAQVRAARLRADHVIFSLHTHLSEGKASGTAPQAIRNFARQAIEAGADIVIGHGPHELRGIEIYQGRPICYSLGNFIFHAPKIERQPRELYELAGVDATRATLDDLLLAHQHILSDAELWQSVIVKLVVDADGRRFVELHPVELAFDGAGSQLGTPRKATGAMAQRIVERITNLSRCFGTQVVFSQGIGIIACDDVSSPPRYWDQLVATRVRLARD